MSNIKYNLTKQQYRFLDKTIPLTLFLLYNVNDWLTKIVTTREYYEADRLLLNEIRQEYINRYR